MRISFASIPVMIALLAPCSAAAQNTGAATQSLCVNCTAAAATQTTATNAAAMGGVEEKAVDAAEPYKGPRTVPAFVARRAALLALLCGRKPGETGR